MWVRIPGQRLRQWDDADGAGGRGWGADSGKFKNRSPKFVSVVSSEIMAAVRNLVGSIHWWHPDREVRNITSFYGSSCANNGKGALNTPDVSYDVFYVAYYTLTFFVLANLGYKCFSKLIKQTTLVTSVSQN